jgi:hypothetical protein
MTDQQNQHLDEMIAEAQREYGENSPLAESAKRVAEATRQTLTHNGSNLDFLPQSTRNRIRTRERSQRACEEFCERFCCIDNPGLKALHMTIAASQEAQKLAQDALHSCASFFQSDENGTTLGITHNIDDLDPALYPVVYSTSQPGHRWIIGPGQEFDEVVVRLETDAHCDFSVLPFATNLEKYRFDRGKDCVAQLTEMREGYFNTLKMKMQPTWRIGELFPVSFGNQIVFLKFCTNHLYAFYRKYQINQNECEIIEPWENEGNHW